MIQSLTPPSFCKLGKKSPQPEFLFPLTSPSFPLLPYTMSPLVLFPLLFGIVIIIVHSDIPSNEYDRGGLALLPVPAFPTALPPTLVRPSPLFPPFYFRSETAQQYVLFRSNVKRATSFLFLRVISSFSACRRYHFLSPLFFPLGASRRFEGHSVFFSRKWKRHRQALPSLEDLRRAGAF